MGRRYEDHPFDMAIVAVATLAALGLWLLPPDNLTTVLGATFLLFVPGYTILFGVLPWRTDQGHAPPGRRRQRELDVTRRIVFGSVLSALLTIPAVLLLDLKWDPSSVHTLLGIGLILVALLFPLALVQWYRLPKSRRFAIEFGPRLRSEQEQERRVDAELAVEEKALTSLERQMARDARKEAKETEKAIKSLQRELAKADRKAARKAGRDAAQAPGDVIQRELDALREVASTRPEAQTEEADAAILEGMLTRLAKAEGKGGPAADAASQQRLIETLLRQRRKSAKRDHKNRRKRDAAADRAALAAAHLDVLAAAAGRLADDEGRGALAAILRRLVHGHETPHGRDRQALDRLVAQLHRVEEGSRKRAEAADRRRAAWRQRATRKALRLRHAAGTAAADPAAPDAPWTLAPVTASVAPPPADQLNELTLQDLTDDATRLKAAANLSKKLGALEEDLLKREATLTRRLATAHQKDVRDVNRLLVKTARIVQRDTAQAARGRPDDRDELRAALGRLARDHAVAVAGLDVKAADMEARRAELDVQERRASRVERVQDDAWAADFVNKLAEAAKNAMDKAAGRGVAGALAEVYEGRVREAVRLDADHKERRATQAEGRRDAHSLLAANIHRIHERRDELDERTLELMESVVAKEREAGFRAASDLLAEGVRFLPGAPAPAEGEGDAESSERKAETRAAVVQLPVPPSGDTLHEDKEPAGEDKEGSAADGPTDQDIAELRRVLKEIAREQDTHLATDESALESMAARLAAARHRHDRDDDAATAPLADDASEGYDDLPIRKPEGLDPDLQALSDALDEVARLQVAHRFTHQRAVKRIQRRLAHIAMQRAQRTSMADQRRIRRDARLEARIQHLRARLRTVAHRLEMDQRRRLQQAVADLSRDSDAVNVRDRRFLDRIAAVVARAQQRRLRREQAALRRIERHLNALAARKALHEEQAEATADHAEDQGPDASVADKKARKPTSKTAERRLLVRRARLRRNLSAHDEHRRQAYATIISELPDDALGRLVADPDRLEGLQEELAALADVAARDRRRILAQEARLRKLQSKQGEALADEGRPEDTEETQPAPETEDAEHVPVPRDLERLMRQEARRAKAEERALRQIESQLSRMLALERGEQQRRRDIATLRRLSARAAMRQEKRMQRRDAWNRSRLELQERRQERLRARLEQERLRRKSMPVPVVVQVVPEEARRVTLAVWFYVTLITLAELFVANWLGPFTLASNGLAVRIGIGLHVVLLVALLVHGLLHVRDSRTATGALLVSFIMAPLIRIFSLAMPVVTFSFVQWFTLIGVPLYIALFAIIKSQRLDLAEVGLRRPESKWIGLEVAVVFWSVFFGALEHLILEPNSIFPDLTLTHIAAPALALFVSTGLFEELLFRGVIQHHALRVFRPGMAIFMLNVVFAALHLGNHEIADAVLVFVVGWIYSQVILRTRSLIGISIGHTVANIMLFIVGPYLL